MGKVNDKNEMLNLFLSLGSGITMGLFTFHSLASIKAISLPLNLVLSAAFTFGQMSLILSELKD